MSSEYFSLMSATNIKRWHFMYHKFIIISWGQGNLRRNATNYTKLEICLNIIKHDQIMPIYPFSPETSYKAITINYQGRQSYRIITIQLIPNSFSHK